MHTNRWERRHPAGLVGTDPQKKRGIPELPGHVDFGPSEGGMIGGMHCAFPPYTGFAPV